MSEPEEPAQPDTGTEEDTAACTGVEVEAAAEAEGKMLEDAAADKSAGGDEAAPDTQQLPIEQDPMLLAVQDSGSSSKQLAGSKSLERTQSSAASKAAADPAAAPAAAAAPSQAIEAAAAAKLAAGIGAAAAASPPAKPAATKKVTKKVAAAKPAAAQSPSAAAPPETAAGDPSPAAALTGSAAAAAKPAAMKPKLKPAVKKAAAAKPAAAASADTAPAAAASSPTAAAAAAAAAPSKPAATKPAAKKKLPQVAMAAASGAAAPAASHVPAASTAASHSHGSSTSRRLQALLAEGSALSVLSTEGSELPGSRPPAQLHGTLEGSGCGGADAEQEQEIQKIISEIHGTGVDSEDDEAPSRLSVGRSSSTAAADGPAAAAGCCSVPALPAGLMSTQPVDDDVALHEPRPSHRCSHAAAEAPATAADADADAGADAAEHAQHFGAQEADTHGAWVSSWPDGPQMRQELLEQKSSTSDGTAAGGGPRAAAAAAAAAGGGGLTARSAAAAAATWLCQQLRLMQPAALGTMAEVNLREQRHTSQWPTQQQGRGSGTTSSCRMEAMKMSARRRLQCNWRSFTKNRGGCNCKARCCSSEPLKCQCRWWLAPAAAAAPTTHFLGINCSSMLSVQCRRVTQQISARSQTTWLQRRRLQATSAAAAPETSPSCCLAGHYWQARLAMTHWQRLVGCRCTSQGIARPARWPAAGQGSTGAYPAGVAQCRRASPGRSARCRRRLLTAMQALAGLAVPVAHWVECQSRMLLTATRCTQTELGLQHVQLQQQT
ncbi:hypothetical protein COO60DRAFT_199672 [Scenedesmus sp. NREL 46B-D3]|nr:hypothetical protein COO60DRAFT_199672 [Scenedesmus sp. NREL 46B-D3]